LRLFLPQLLHPPLPSGVGQGITPRPQPQTGRATFEASDFPIDSKLFVLRNSSADDNLYIDPDTVTDKDLNRLVRGHWQVENCLHLVKDRWWDEDKHYLKRPGLGNVFAELRNAALSVLRLVKKPGESFTKAAEYFLYAPRKALRLLGLSKK